MASKDQFEYSLELIGQISVKDLAEKVATELSTTLKTVQDVSQLIDNSSDPCDKEIAQAVQTIQEVVEVCFVIARAFINKVHSLATFICEEEPYTIQAIEEGNAEEFKAYLKEVLDKSKACQEDLQALIVFIENHNQKEIDKQEEKIKSIASKDASKDASTKTAARSEAAIGAIGGVAGAAGHLLSLSGLILAGFAGLPIFGLAGLTVAIGGLIYASQNNVAYTRYKEVAAKSERALNAIEQMKSNFQTLKESLETINKSLKAEIDHCYNQELSRKKGVIQQSLKIKVREVTDKANHLKEYCQPLKEAKSAQEFIQKIVSYG